MTKLNVEAIRRLSGEITEVVFCVSPREQARGFMLGVRPFEVRVRVAGCATPEREVEAARAALTQIARHLADDAARVDA